MRQLLISMAALTLLPMTANAQEPGATATPIGAPYGATTLSLAVTGTASGQPDIARMSAGVNTLAATAEAALADNAKAMTALIATLGKQGIAKADIQTSGFSLNPQYRYPQQGEDPNTPPRIIGYQVSNTVSLTVRDIKKIGRTFDALTAAGATNINGPSFEIDDDAALLKEARTKALAEGQQLAEFYAKAAGKRRARLVAISEGGSPVMPVPMFKSARAAADVATPVEPGRSDVNVALNLMFSLE